MRLGVVADIHGNAAALDAVLADAAPLDVERWWALGDLVLFGPRPVEVLETLAALPDVAYVSGNTDRYVLTGEMPHPHATAAAAAGDVALVERFGKMSGAIGWTQGALSQAGLLDGLEDLASEQRITLPDQSVLLGVHASLGRDDGAGISSRMSDEELASVLEGCDADTVVGGHTHDPTDRTVGGVRALNPGSTGLPRSADGARWMLIDADQSGVRVEHRRVAFDVEATITDLEQRRYPNAAFLATILRGTRVFG